MKRSVLVLTILALALAMGLPTAGPALAQINQASLRVVQASPNAPLVDASINGQITFSNISFKNVTPYTCVPSGAASVSLVPAGTNLSPILSTTPTLAPGTSHTLVAVGLANNVQPLLLVDDNSAPAVGQTRVRLVNASPNAPAIDVAIAGGPVLFSNVPFTGVGNYISITAGTFNLEVRLAGTGNVLLSLPSVMFCSCAVYTIFVEGLVNQQPALTAVISADSINGCRTVVAGVAATATFTPTPTPTFTPTATMTPTTTAVTTRTPAVVTATAVTTGTPAVVTATAAMTATPAVVTATAAASATRTTAAATRTTAATATRAPTTAPTTMPTVKPTSVPTAMAQASATP